MRAFVIKFTVSAREVSEHTFVVCSSDKESAIKRAFKELEPTLPLNKQEVMGIYADTIEREVLT